MGKKHNAPQLPLMSDEESEERARAEQRALEEANACADWEEDLSAWLALTNAERDSRIRNASKTGESFVNASDKSMLDHWIEAFVSPVYARRLGLYARRSGELPDDGPEMRVRDDWDAQDEESDAADDS